MLWGEQDEFASCSLPAVRAEGMCLAGTPSSMGVNGEGGGLVEARSLLLVGKIVHISRTGSLTDFLAYA